ncbi:MAG: signal peptidase II [Chlamydiota bacterium]
MKKALIFLSVLLGIDIATKYLTYWYVPQMIWMHASYPYGGYGIFENLFGGVSLSINHVQNRGAAWGFFSQYSEQLLGLRAIMVTALCVYTILYVGRERKKWLFFFIIAGALGNIIDHYFYGSVIDMIHFNFWGYTFPLFNFADICISLGIFLLVFPPLFVRRPEVRSWQ